MTEPDIQSIPDQELAPLSQKSFWKRRRTKILLFTLILIGVGIASYFLYQADIDWEDKIDKYGLFGIFILGFVNSMTIFVPLPGEVALFAAPGIMDSNWVEAFWIGVFAGVGSAFGESTAYFAGLWGRFAIPVKYQKSYDRVERWMRRYGAVAIFVFALTPLPFDVVGIVAGVLRFRFWKFFIFCGLGRLLRALVIVYSGWAGYGWVENLF